MEDRTLASMPMPRLDREFAVTVALALLSFGCDGPSILGNEAASEDPPPSSFSYELGRYDAPDEDGDHRWPKDAILMLGDRELSKNGEPFELGADEYLLEDPSLVSLALDTTCGRQPLPLDIPAKYDVEHEKNARDQAAKRLRQGKAKIQRWAQSWKTKEPVELTQIDLYIDNEGRDQPAEVTLGTLRHTVEANGTLTISTIVGDCPEARTVTVDGEVVGEAQWSKKKEKYERKLRASSTRHREGYAWEQAFALDIAGSHCYGTKLDVYSGAVYEDDLKLEEISRPKGKRLFETRKVNHAFQVNPEASAKRKSSVALLRIKC